MPFFQIIFFLICNNTKDLNAHKLQPKTTLDNVCLLCLENKNYSLEAKQLSHHLLFYQWGIYYEFLPLTTYCVLLWHEGYPFNMTVAYTNVESEHELLRTIPSKNMLLVIFCTFYLINWSHRKQWNKAKKLSLSKCQCSTSKVMLTTKSNLLYTKYWTLAYSFTNFSH